MAYRRALDTRRRFALVGRLRPHRGFFVMAVRQYPTNLEGAIYRRPGHSQCITIGLIAPYQLCTSPLYRPRHIYCR